jgi:hypothetical protein
MKNHLFLIAAAALLVFACTPIADRIAQLVKRNFFIALNI